MPRRDTRIKLTHQQTTPVFYIGKVMEITGASRKAIRHYEQLGLLPRPARKGKYRIFSEMDVFLIHMIKEAQSVGFTLSELRELVLRTAHARRLPLRFANQLFDAKRSSFNEEIQKIRSMQKALSQLQKEMNKIFSD